MLQNKTKEAILSEGMNLIKERLAIIEEKIDYLIDGKPKDKRGRPKKDKAEEHFDELVKKARSEPEKDSVKRVEKPEAVQDPEVTEPDPEPDEIEPIPEETEEVIS